MPIEVQAVSGKIQHGTPLFRLSLALLVPDTVKHAEVYAGDITDVCDALDSKQKIVIDMRAKAGEESHKVCKVRVDELRAFVQYAAANASSNRSAAA